MREIESAVRAIPASGETDARTDELLSEVRRMSDALHGGKLSLQGLATQAEMSAYFADLEKELRRIEKEVCAITASGKKNNKVDEEQAMYGSARNEMVLLNDALKRVKKRLRQANESMEEAAHHSKSVQKKMIRDVGENE